MDELTGSTRTLTVLQRRQAALGARAALIATTSPLVWVALAWAQRAHPLAGAEASLVLWLAGGSSALLVSSAALLALGRRLACWTFPLGIIAGAVLFVLVSRRAPDVAFVSLAWSALLSYFVGCKGFSLRDIEGRRVVLTAALASPAVIASGSLALSLAAASAGHGLLASPLGARSVLALLLLPCALATAAEWVLVRRGELRPLTAALLFALTISGLALAWLPGLAAALLGGRALLAVAGAVRAHEAYEDMRRYLWRRPALLVVFTFFALALTGGVVLTFPACTVRPIADLDAFFTAVSACCVTGLTVLDTAVDFTFTGQLVILVLIQVGGLGIMTLSAVGTLILEGGMASDAERTLGETVGAATPYATVRLVKAIAILTLIIETAGICILFPAFLVEGAPAPEAFWKASFHSVSAFCNAGFALQSTSFLAYQDNPLVLDTLSVLIILGGLGFGVLVAVHDLLRRRSRQISLHVKLVLSMTAFLAVSGLLAFALLEWDHSLSGQEGVALKLHNAWFQSITPRTAGFNSVDLSLLRPATILVLMVLMFIGASPVSTGGGIKTATSAVLLLAIRAVVTQAGDTEAFGRRIPASIVYRAAAVATLSALFILGGTLVLLATQGASWSPGQARAFSFEGLFFEAVSAFGTVGLSLGATPLLDSVGKFVIMGLMLAGRTGPLTVALLLQQAPQRIRYPREDVVVG